MIGLVRVARKICAWKLRLMMELDNRDLRSARVMAGPGLRLGLEPRVFI